MLGNLAPYHGGNVISVEQIRVLIHRNDLVAFFIYLVLPTNILTLLAYSAGLLTLSQCLGVIASTVFVCVFFWIDEKIWLNNRKRGLGDE